MIRILAIAGLLALSIPAQAQTLDKIRKSGVTFVDGGSLLAGAAGRLQRF